MMHDNHITKEPKGSHLSFKERGQIEILFGLKYSGNAIAKELGRARKTIHDEIKDGKVTQVKKEHGKKKFFTTYSAEAGQAK